MGVVLGEHMDAVAAAPDFRPYSKSGKLQLLATYVSNSSQFSGQCHLQGTGYDVTIRYETRSLIGPKGSPHAIVDKLTLCTTGNHAKLPYSRRRCKISRINSSMKTRGVCEGLRQGWNGTCGEIVRKAWPKGRVKEI